ncbi:ribonuclease H-like [Protopterus annectens]|uniref:ribonuclease H-like n=1 Tax=Protopterus annectens TaxID=7888 RepID=UPI001CF971D5|nr:ribonuclease H-like [Protopterus annectens]
MGTQTIEEASELYTDGSRFWSSEKGCFVTGWAIYNAETKEHKKGSLPGGCSAQKAKLEAVKQALLLPRPVNIYIDSEYVVRVLASSLPIWARRGLITAGGKPISHQEVLTAIWSLIKDDNPSTVSINKVKAHTKNEVHSQANKIVDRLAK